METRRSFLKLSATGLLALPFLSQCAERKKITHIVSISFDDGFARSFIKTAEIYEKYDLQACFNVMASGGQSDFKPPDDYIQPGILGDFELWNELKRRGHEIMPHGYKHANLAHLEFSEACDLVQRSLDSFAENLIDFDAQRAIFNFPFNSSTLALEEWLNEKVLAYRTSGSVLNKMPHRRQKKLTCISAGPDNIDAFFEEQLQLFLRQPKGWFIFNAHGLDGEGWGPMSSSYLDELIHSLQSLDHVSVLPVGEALLSKRSPT